jgi:tight adherence protein B
MTLSYDLWIVIGAVFAMVFLLSQAMIVPVFGESRKTRKRLRARLGEIERELGASSFSSLLREKYLRELSPLERTLESLPFMAGITDMIEQAGYSILAHRLALISVAAGTVGAVVTWVFMHHLLLALLAFAVLGAVPFLKVSNARAKRLLKIEEQLPEAVDMMKRALRAGHPFSGAVKLVSEELEAPLGKEFVTTFADLNYGNDVRRAMLGLLQRVPSVAVMGCSCRKKRAAISPRSSAKSAASCAGGSSWNARSERCRPKGGCPPGFWPSCRSCCSSSSR